MSCDGKWDEHVVLYEDEELRKELGKPVGEAFYPLSDVPEIQQQFLKANFFQKGYFRISEYPLFCQFFGEFLSKFLLQYELCLKSFNFNKQYFEKKLRKMQKKRMFTL